MSSASISILSCVKRIVLKWVTWTNMNSASAALGCVTFRRAVPAYMPFTEHRLPIAYMPSTEPPFLATSRLPGSWV